MGRKRKLSIVDDEKENEDERRSGASMDTAIPFEGPMYTVMSSIQFNETHHKKYVKELKQLYQKMPHKAFIFLFVKMLKTAMVAEEFNEYAHTTMLFCAKFVGAFNGDETHPMLLDTFQWLLTTVSNNPLIRFRLCQFVNMILNALGQEAALDDSICDHIMEYMLERLRDVAPRVRLQAILAMQRLQVPDNPDDPVLRAYQFHLGADPSPRVRQAVITCMGRNYHTIPFILERLWDIDEKVRRHTYLNMSGYPVRSYKVSQRLTLLEQGLNDRSDAVRKVAVGIMLKQWIESYQRNLILLVSALKLDASDAEIERFRKVTKQTLAEVFKHTPIEELVGWLPMAEESEFRCCVPHESLSMEVVLYWQCLVVYLQSELAEELDQILPELSTFCAYVECYCQSKKAVTDTFEQMEFQYVLLSLMEILYSYDLGDEIGRGNLRKLLANLLQTYALDEKVIRVVVQCVENLIEEQDTRFKFFLEIVQEMCGLNAKPKDWVHDRNLINELLANCPEATEALNLKISALKVKILELEEQEMNWLQQRDFVRAQDITEEKNAATEEYMNLLKPLVERHDNKNNNNETGGGGGEGEGDTTTRRSLTLPESKVVKSETILKCMQILYHMVVSKKVHSLTPSISTLYNDLICRHIASNQTATRDWALKCGTAFSMLYEPFARDIFEELYSQFFKNHNIRLWETSIRCIFELLDRYGVDSFVMSRSEIKDKRNGRQLYNSTLQNLDADDETQVSATGQGVSVISMLSHFLNTCDDICIINALIIGFCRLVLHEHITAPDILEKLLVRYFNPATDPEINQILGVFLEHLIQRKRQNLLQECLMPTLFSVLIAPYDSPLRDVRPETITRFVIDTTQPADVGVPPSENIHNKIAESFLKEMINNVTNKDLCKLLAKELLKLQLSTENNERQKSLFRDMADHLLQSEFDGGVKKHLNNFKDMLEGRYRPQTTTVDDNDSDDGAMTTTTEMSGKEKDVAVTPEKTMEPILEEETTVTPNRSNAPTPTTFGRGNRTGQRCLRRSLNVSVSLCFSDAQVSGIETPPDAKASSSTRSPKIRIEARIDSDKKSASEKAAVERRNLRAKRSLRYNKKDAPKETPAEKVESAAVEPSPQSSVRIEDPLHAGRATRNAARNAKTAMSTRSQPRPQAANLDDSDVILASPSSESPAQQRSLLRRGGGQTPVTRSGRNYDTTPREPPKRPPADQQPASQGDGERTEKTPVRRPPKGLHESKSSAESPPAPVPSKQLRARPAPPPVLSEREARGQRKRKLVSSPLVAPTAAKTASRGRPRLRRSMDSGERTPASSSAVLSPSSVPLVTSKLAHRTRSTSQRPSPPPQTRRAAVVATRALRRQRNSKTVATEFLNTLLTSPRRGGHANGQNTVGVATRRKAAQ